MAEIHDENTEIHDENTKIDGADPTLEALQHVYGQLVAHWHETLRETLAAGKAGIIDRDQVIAASSAFDALAGLAHTLGYEDWLQGGLWGRHCST